MRRETHQRQKKEDISLSYRHTNVGRKIYIFIYRPSMYIGVRCVCLRGEMHSLSEEGGWLVISFFFIPFLSFFSFFFISFFFAVHLSRNGSSSSSGHLSAIFISAHVHQSVARSRRYCWQRRGVQCLLLCPLLSVRGQSATLTDCPFCGLPPYHRRRATS